MSNLFSVSLVISSIILLGAMPAFILNAYYIWKKRRQMTPGLFAIFGGGIVVPLGMAVSLQITVANYGDKQLSGWGILLLIFVAMGLNMYAAYLPNYTLAIEEGMLKQSENCQEKLEAAENLIAHQESIINMAVTTNALLKKKLGQSAPGSEGGGDANQP